jgi:hypothetical protein
MVARRRERIVTVASILLQEAVMDGELPVETNVNDGARMIAALLDGLVIEHIESPGALRRMDARRHARMVLGLDAEGSSGKRMVS